jgi:hypothetical protein
MTSALGKLTWRRFYQLGPPVPFPGSVIPSKRSLGRDLGVQAHVVAKSAHKFIGAVSTVEPIITLSATKVVVTPDSNDLVGTDAA